MNAIARSSFRAAAALLPGETAGAVRDLYSACRLVDDLADAGTHADPQTALNRLREDLQQKTARSDVTQTFLRLHRTRGLDLTPAQDLVVAVAGDLDHRPFTNTEMLLDYAQGVAGTVGLMMCDIFGVHDAEARARGAALGRAMQLTNVARDVQIDARLGRRYLPQTLCPIPPHDLTRRETCALPPVRDAVRTILQRAEGLYAEGLQGLPSLPPTVRIAVAVAALSYRDIGRRIAANGYHVAAQVDRPGIVRRTRLSAQAIRLATGPLGRRTAYGI